MLAQKNRKYNTPMELSCIQPFGIISQWTGYLQPLHFHMVSPVYAQTCLISYLICPIFRKFTNLSGKTGQNITVTIQSLAYFFFSDMVQSYL